MPPLTPTVSAQTAPVGAGFRIDAGDLRFIFHAIEVAQDHAAGGTLLGSGPNQVNLFGTANAQLPLGLRTVDGSYNNLVPVPDQHLFGASDLLFPRLTTPVFRTAEQGSSYVQLTGNVFDSQPRLASNLIVDQKRATNPAAAFAADHACGSGQFVCSEPAPDDPVTGTTFIPNITPDFGLSAPFNLMFTFFGQFFDHGLDLVNKGGNGTVIIPLQPDDPLFVPGSPTNFMAVTRASVDANHNSVNQTTPWVDQNQTYTSHPAHQVFLRSYDMVLGGSPATLRPVPNGMVLDGGFCSPRANGVPGEQICNIADWAEVKDQAAHKLGIQLLDSDVFDVPLVVTDPYGHFKPGAHGFPLLALAAGGFLEGDPTANGGLGVDASGAFRTGHQFLNDIAHNAAPNPGLQAKRNGHPCHFRDTTCTTPAGFYDGDLLDRHFVTGDGRGNENIALTAMHTIFHAEHNRLRNDIDRLINTPGFLTPAEVAAWHAVHPGSGWGYGERLFQAARVCTEMQYQHLVFEEFARKLQPLINPFLGGITDINPAIEAEFAHTVYRLGHSMLPEVVARKNADGADEDMRLLDAFLNPVAFNEVKTQAPGGGTVVVTQSASQAVGSLVRGLSQQVGNELDEFVTDSVRNTLVGLPLDLAAVNLARGRSEGIPPLNQARAQLFATTHNSALTPYADWAEFGQNLKHIQSLPNFLAAYGTHPGITGATTMAAKRAAAQALITADDPFLHAPAATSGLNDVDFWVGGLAERQAAFGGLLGTTFNYVFEAQLEKLQNGDRFYYLQRLDGLNLRDQLESNSFTELIRRNADTGPTMDVVFETADFNFTPASPTGVDLGGGIMLVAQTDGTTLFFDPLHRGKNITFDGGPGNDRFRADIGDDSLFGNAGNDRMWGNDGNDTLIGGDGDDVLFGDNGDDVLKGGAGNDALASGPGFGGDILLGGDGNDFLLGGDDGVEHFGGPGDDVVVDGDQRAEAIFGGTGDDWLYGGDGHDGGMFGDDGNVFDLLAGVSPVGGDDVCDGGPGQDNCFGEGGDDIMLPSEGTNKFFGDYGFDWFTMRSWPVRAELTGATGFSVDLSLLAVPNVPINFNDLRNKYRFIDGASGWNLNDEIRGDNNTLCNPPGEVAECLIVGMELTAGTPPVTEPAVGVPGQVNFRGGSGAAKITGLTTLMGPGGFNKSLTDPAVPGVKGVGFMGGNILLGGLGSDFLEGGGGDDLIDGDRWLNVQLRAVMNDGTVRLVDNAQDLTLDVFADPQRLNPGNISIVRSIVTPASVPPPDCGSPTPLNCDVASFRDIRANYDITVNPNGSVTVAHVVVAAVAINDGTDTLLNIEQLRFTDTTIPTPGSTNNAAVPNVVGLTQAAATTAIGAASLRLGTVTTASSMTIPSGTVISQAPLAGSPLVVSGRVAILVSSGPPPATVPNVVGLPQAAAGTAITAANLTLGPVTTAPSTTVVSGNVISQNPLAGQVVVSLSPVSLVVSSGPPVTVPNVVGLTQSAAASAITAVGMTANSTTVSSTTVAAGRVISQNPAGGASVQSGSAVSIVVSSGPPATVPNVVSSTQTAAQTSITNAGLIVGTITNANDDVVPAGSVISQSPAGGTIVQRGSAVSMVVSLGSLGPVVELPASPFAVTPPNVKAGASKTINVTVTNNGPGILNISSVSTTGTGFAADRGTCNVPIGSTPKTCKLNLTFSPATVGTFNGTLTIFSNARNSPTTISLTATSIH